MLKKIRDIEREAGVDVRIKSDLDKSEVTTEGSDDEHASGDRSAENTFINTMYNV